MQRYEKNLEYANFETQKMKFFDKNLHISKKSSTFAAQNVNNTIMPSAEVQKMIPQIREYLATQPVERAYLFGSCSRGEETPESDIDILVSLDYTQPIGMRYFGMITDLEERLGRTVDLVSEEGLMSFARPSVERDKLLVYERSH